MKNMKKKGFTLVELLVVIAIVAILAVVSVVGYTVFIDKANKSNDTAIASELNTLLIGEGVTDKAESFEDVVEILYNNGFYLANLNAKTDGCFFVWDSAKNQILLVDAKDNFNVIFPEDYSGEHANWNIACSDKDLIAKYTLPAGVTVQRTASNVESLNEFIAEGGEKTVFIDQGFAVDKENTIVIDNPGANVTLVLGDSTLTSNGTIEGAPIFVKQGSVTVEGGTLAATGTATSEHGTFNVSVAYITKGTINMTFTGTTFTGTTAINGTFNGAEAGTTTITVKDCVFDVENSAVIASPDASQGSYTNITLINTTIDAGSYALFASYGGTITVESGSYNGTIYLQNTGASHVDSKIVIKGGTFSNTGLTLDQFKALVESGKTVVENADGSWTVQ